MYRYITTQVIALMKKVSTLRKINTILLNIK